MVLGCLVLSFVFAAVVDVRELLISCYVYLVRKICWLSVKLAGRL
jgi:hypothetical protein